MLPWILLGVVVCVAGFFIYNLLRQVAALEEEILIGDKLLRDREEKTIQIYTFFLKLFTGTLKDMEEIDRKGAFKADDEVGFTFNALLESIKQVKFQIENLKTPTDEINNKLEE